MADDLRALGPWPRGLNNVDDAQSRRFQPPHPKEMRPEPAQLRAAVNVDLDRDGWLRRRVGRTKLATLTDGHSLHAVGNRLLLVDNGDLVAYDPTAQVRTTLQAGIGHGPLSCETVAGVTWWTNGERCGRIELGVPRPWGLTLPVVAGATASGSLRPARYLFAVTVETADGIESGARQPQALTLTSPGAIALSVANLDPAATHLNLYCSEPDGQTLFFVGRVPAAATAIIDRTGVSTDPLTTFNHYPPPPGRFVRAHAGRLLVAAGRELYWSQPLAYHHFAIATDVQLFDTPVRLLEPVDGGFYVATDSATWWVAGDDPESWRPMELDSAPVASGAALRLPGYKVPGLEDPRPVVVWATANGFVAGLPGGQIRPLTDGRVAMDAHAQASLAYREEDGIRQILLSLRQQTQTSRLGATDRISCRVIRAGCND